MAHELMEHDNMFSVQETPWHGLGIILPNAPSIDDALRIAKLDWQVRMLPLYAQDPQNTLMPVDAHKAIQREDTGEIFTVTSKYYTPLQNAEAFDVFRPLVEDGSIELETAGSLQNGRKVWILAKIATTDAMEVRDGDTIKP
ncbi:MAG: DUF932 domain-containing protein, partial [Anaerolineaceae bacterium]|nr:DUF932 domain-containing protein [Anaerolineaceae bacterium]